MSKRNRQKNDLLKQEDAMKLIGDLWWSVNTKVDGIKIKEAIIRNSDKEIVLDYKYQGNNELMTLKSEDGIHFQGEYGLQQEKFGNCEFTLYKNTEGYFLYGGWSDSEEGNSVCWVKLSSKNLLK